MSDRVLHLSLDINILYAERLAMLRGVRGTAAHYLVEAVRNGECDAGPVQLITSVPMIENWASVLVRHFGCDQDTAEETAWLLHDYAEEGPLGTLPNLVVGSGHIPFASEAAERAAAQQHIMAEDGKLFDEISDDRHVLLGALGGHADLLATSDVDDFNRGPARAFANRKDVILFPTATSALVIGSPAFLVHWLRQGIIPDACFIGDRSEEFCLPEE